MLKCSNNSMVKLIDKDYINLTEKYKQYSKKYNKIKFFDFHQSTQGHFYSVLRMFGGSETPPRTFLDHSGPHTRQCNYTPAL